MNTDLTSTAQTNFSLWAQALETQDPQVVANLYDENALFLATRSPEFKKDHTGVIRYFSQFLLRKPVVRIVEEEVKELSATCYLHTGFYDFDCEIEGQQQTVHARFTFVWEQNEEGDWKIVHHHSSAVPTNA